MTRTRAFVRKEFCRDEKETLYINIYPRCVVHLFNVAPAIFTGERTNNRECSKLGHCFHLKGFACRDRRCRAAKTEKRCLILVFKCYYVG